MQRTAFRTCPFCEATCGLELTLDGDTVTKVQGDAEDVFSKGFICPKSTGVKGIHEDPDRIRTPLIRQPDGSFASASWDQAFELIAERLGGIFEAHGRDAVAMYIGNPAAHGLAPLLYGRVLAKALGTKAIFTASTVDQRPKEIASGLMFGGAASIPVPDLDRTDFLLMLGANPLHSNGSLCTAPDFRGRIRAIRERGGRVVVVDPRRTRTAEEAGEHLAIRPGTDALLLWALVHVLDAEGLVAPGRLSEWLEGVDEVLEISRDFSPEAVAHATGLDADAIRELAHGLAGAERAAVYGRIGTTTQAFGTQVSWLVDVVNALTGNLDREGGAMWTLAAAGQSNSRGEPGKGRGVTIGRWNSRVRGAPETFGELPAACLAEEIETPGEGQLRALITLAGNPAVSTPNAGRLRAALGTLDFMVSVDIYVNETTSFADVILPAPSPLERPHFDLALYQFAVRNVTNWSPAVVEPDPGVPDEWITLLRLVGIAAGQGAHADVEALDRFVAFEAARRETADPHSVVAGRDPEELLAAMEPRVGPERMVDLMLRVGPYGEGFGANPDGLTLEVLEANPHGVDLGPLQPRLPGVLRTRSGRIELAPPELLGDVPRLRSHLEELSGLNGDAPLVLVGRRHLRSNNSWMHNLTPLVKGKDRCTLHVHPDDASRLGLEDGAPATVTSAAGAVDAPVEITDGIRPGVVSLPHGWGHDADGVELSVARAHAGVNSNLLADESQLDPLSGNAVLNGIPVVLAPVRATAGEPTVA